MKRSISTLLFAALLAVSATSANNSTGTRETTTTIGSIQDRFGNKIELSVVEKKGSKKAVIWVADDYIIETVRLEASKDKLRTLKTIIENTLEELDR